MGKPKQKKKKKTEKDTTFVLKDGCILFGNFIYSNVKGRLIWMLKANI